MCADTCTGISTGKCVDMHDMCADMDMDILMDMCIGMRIDMRPEPRPCRNQPMHLCLGMGMATWAW